MKLKTVVEAIVVLAALVLNCACATEPAIPEQIGAFVGNWVNVDLATRSLPQAEIKLRDGRIAIHLWGKCHPENCDWGEVTARSQDASDGVLHVYWNQGFVVRSQTLTALANGRLEVATRSTYNDGRATRSDTDLFARK